MNDRDGSKSSPLGTPVRVMGAIGGSIVSAMGAVGRVVSSLPKSRGGR